MIVAPPRALLAALSLAALLGNAQDRLKLVPAYERYQKLSKEPGDAVRSGALSVTWKDGGKAFEYQKEGKRFRYDIETRTMEQLVSEPAKGTTNASSAASRSRGERRRRPGLTGR